MEDSTWGGGVTSVVVVVADGEVDGWRTVHGGEGSPALLSLLQIEKLTCGGQYMGGPGGGVTNVVVLVADEEGDVMYMEDSTLGWGHVRCCRCCRWGR